MVGVDWLWTQTEEVSLEDMRRHCIVRAAYCVVLARFSSEHAILWSEYIMVNLEGVSNEFQASVSESVI